MGHYFFVQIITFRKQNRRRTVYGKNFERKRTWEVFVSEKRWTIPGKGRRTRTRDSGKDKCTYGQATFVTRCFENKMDAKVVQ